MHVFTCPIITVICMQVSKTTTEHEMLKARITLKNLENLTYNFPNDSTIAMEFNQKLSQLFDCYYSKLSQEAGILIRPVTKFRMRMIKRKYRKLCNPVWKVSSLPRVCKKKNKKRKKKKVLKACSSIPDVHACVSFIYVINRVYLHAC